MEQDSKAVCGSCEQTVLRKDIVPFLGICGACYADYVMEMERSDSEAFEYAH